ncbi:hypothetical protein GCM10009569_35040 [Arthrobacter russicus]|uniref:Uncharacterized protein n=2 Tax=Bacillati TaxID=1783272 RepID=A0ABU1J904_9MICC|nr:hypothetical protein [Arthrobacter russicus]
MTATATLAKYQALADQATSGPWSFLPLVNGMPARTISARPGFGTPTVASVQAEPDGAFITASRSLGPAMAAALQEILELHKKDPGSHPYEDLCTVCGDYYPCPTVSTITKHLEGK